MRTHKTISRNQTTLPSVSLSTNLADRFQSSSGFFLRGEVARLQWPYICVWSVRVRVPVSVCVSNAAESSGRQCVRSVFALWYCYTQVCITPPKEKCFSPAPISPIFFLLLLRPPVFPLSPSRAQACECVSVRVCVCVPLLESKTTFGLAR